MIARTLPPTQASWRASRRTAGFFAVACLVSAAAAWGSPGDLVWENRGQSDPVGVARAIDAEGNVVVATGETGQCAYPDFITCHWFVRAHDASTGGTLWEDKLDAGGVTGSARGVAVHGGRAFAAGWVQGQRQPRDFLVRAYSLDHGTLLWERRLHGNRSQFSLGGLVSHEGRVFVTGIASDELGRRDFALLVLDEQTGNTLWESLTAGLAAPGGPFGIAGGVRVQGDEVFVAGFVSSAAPSGFSLLVEAHDARTGALVWKDELADGYFFVASDPGDLAVDRNLLFVAARILTSDPGIGSDFMLRAYDARTGAVRWTDYVHRQAGGGATRLGVGAGKVFAYGWDCDASAFNCHGDVRAYDPRSGTLQWEDRFTGPGGDSLFPADAFAVHGSQVFVGNGLLNAAQDHYEWTVRSYDTTDGTLRWETQSHDDAFLSTPGALKTFGGRLYAGGAAVEFDGTSVFTVRAYSVPSEP